MFFFPLRVTYVHRANTEFAAQLSRGVAGLLQTCGDKDMSVWTVADEHLNKVIKVKQHKTATSDGALELMCAVFLSRR